jgi:hypothetical protein
MAEETTAPTARDRLRRASNERLSEDELARLAPQLAELIAGLTMLERRLALEAEPATVQRVVGSE